jgi:hypothetical protein
VHGRTPRVSAKGIFWAYITYPEGIYLLPCSDNIVSEFARFLDVKDETLSKRLLCYVVIPHSFVVTVPCGSFGFPCRFRVVLPGGFVAESVQK